MTLLSVENLKVYFRADSRTAKAVDGVSFRVEKGQTHALVGESGCGKSVTALSIAGLLPPASVSEKSGRIIFQGRDLTGITRDDYRKIRGSEIAMIFQEPMTALNPVMKVGEQILEAVKIAPHKSLGIADDRGSISHDRLKKRVLELMDMTGLKSPDKLYNRYPHELSGGMRQRIMIAAALSCRPALVIADEPTTALDVTIQAQILSLLNDLRKETGSSILLITHDLGVVSRTAHTMSVLYAGQVVEEGKVKDVFDEPCHPYTISLFGALPSGSMNRMQRLNSIAGTVPPATEYDSLPSGCRFYERCPYQDERCFKKSNREGHRSWCGREGI